MSARDSDDSGIGSQADDQEIVDENPEMIAEGLDAARTAMAAMLAATSHPSDDAAEAVKAAEGLNPNTVPDALLLRFLRVTKFNPEKAARLYLSYRKRKHELFPNEKLDSADPPTIDDDLRATLSIGFVQLPNARDKLGRQVVIFRPTMFDYTKDYCTPEKIARAAFFVMDGALARSEQTQRFGLSMLGLIKGVGLVNFNRKTSQLILDNVQNKLPLRIGRVCMMDQPIIFSFIFKIIKMFMKEKLKRRIKVLGKNHDKLLEYLDPESIPEELGGSLVLDPEAFVASLDK